MLNKSQDSAMPKFSFVERDERVASYMSLVRKMSYQLSARLPDCVSQEDMLQAGVIGLVEAANNYDPSKGASFGTYAGIRIHGAMIDELRRGDWAPRSVHRASRALNEAIYKIESQTGLPSSLQELATELNIPIPQVSKIIADTYNKTMISYGDTGIDEGQLSVDMFKNLASPLDFAQVQQRHCILTEYIALLPDREKTVITFHYLHEYPLKQIASILQISESRVSQLMHDAFHRLRRVLKDYSLL